MTRDFRTLGESLRPILAERGITMPDTPLYELQIIPPTWVVQDGLDAARSRLVVLEASPATPASTLRIARESLARQERRYADAIRRDALQADRPDGCWCLGAGGKAPRFLPIFKGDYWTDPNGNETPLIEESPVLGLYCDCLEGIERKEADDILRDWYAADRQTRRMAKLFGASKIPKEYQRFPWRDHPQKATVRHVEAWLNDPGDTPWLVLWGDVGRGKTTFLAGIASDLIEARKSVLFRPMPDLMGDIRASWDKDNPASESEIIALLKAVQHLAIDDLGAEAPKDWAGERMYQIVNHRHNEHLPILATSNLGPQELTVHLGDRLFGRFKRLARFVHVGGSDLRSVYQSP